MRTTLVCMGSDGKLASLPLVSREGAPETLVVKGKAFQKQYEQQMGGEVVAVYGLIPKGVTKTETAK